MPFSANDFKTACHQRATGVAIVSAARPSKAAVVTEHAAAFPPGNADECFVSLIISTRGKTLSAIKRSKYFALSYLRKSQLPIAEALYKLRIKEIQKIVWSNRHNVPFVKNSNAAVVCSLYAQLPLGKNTLIVGHVMGVDVSKKPGNPLVNYKQGYYSVGRQVTPVTHPRRKKNSRLTK